MVFQLLKRFKTIFLFGIGLLFASTICSHAQTKDEVNFKVGNGTSSKDTNVYDSLFFSLEEAVKFPLRVSELSLEGKGLKRFPDAILKFKNLRVLNISNNHIDSIPFSLFHQCRKLNVLQYAGNELNAIPAVLFQASLKVLDLSENNLTTIPDDIGTCRQLEELDLHANHLTTYPSSSVLLKSLKSLILSGNPLTSLSTWIINQPQLKILFIDNTAIEGTYELLCKADALRFLNIEENNMKELPSCFCEMKGLKVILVSGNALPEEKWEELHNCLPDLQIR
ncbi:MAG: Adenylate cyclase [Chitinophagaceae bacterium]|nr:Adenylate cyclase [Chitinophagaceae bacterium]